MNNAVVSENIDMTRLDCSLVSFICFAISGVIGTSMELPSTSTKGTLAKAV